MRIVFSWDDGAIEDLKLFELHKKYGIPGMFFVPTHNQEGRDVISKEDITINCSSLIQFGGHTQNHTYLTEIDICNVEKEIVLNKSFLEDATGHKVLHFCLPGGKYNKTILSIIRKHYKTCRTADTMNLRIKDSFLIKPTIHFYDRGIKSLFLNAIRHFNIAGAFFILKNRKKSYFELIKEYLTFESNKNRTIIIWGHSWELEKYGLWNELEDLFIFIKEKYCHSICSYVSDE